MNILCTPTEISGKIKAISSKSDAHRLLICGALADAPTKVYCNVMSKDIAATVDCLKNMGADIKVDGEIITIIPNKFNEKAELDCGESGSTLRFLLPVVSALGIDTTITGHGRLPERPISPLKEEMERMGVIFHKGSKFPLHLTGQLQAGEYEILGNVSSQFISSILISSPLSERGVTLYVLPEFKSKPYVNMTLDIMRKFGVKALKGYYLKHENCDKDNQSCKIDEFKVMKQDYSACDYTVEGDYSSASYLLALIAINGGKARIKNLFFDSKQKTMTANFILQAISLSFFCF